MASNPLNPTSFRFPFEAQIASLPPEVQEVHRNQWNGLVDVNQAIAALKTQVDAKTTTTTAAATTTENVTNNSETVVQQAQNVIGYVNDQSGETAYATAASDYGSFIILNDASAIAVTLTTGPAIQLPWSTTFINVGTGTATLTPQTGTIDGTGSLSLPGSSSVVVAYDGTNFWAQPLIGAGGGFTNPMTTAGDIIVGGTAGAPTRLGIGANGDVLTVVAGAEAWQAPSGGGGVSSLNTETGAITLTSTGATVTITTPTSSTINLEAAGGGGGYSLGGAVSAANVTLGAGAGSGASIFAVAGLDGSHWVNITIGSSPSTSAPIWTMTFTASRGHTTYPIIQCVSVSSGSLVEVNATHSSASATGYSAGVGPGVTVTPGVTYSWNVSAP